MRAPSRSVNATPVTSRSLMDTGAAAESVGSMGIGGGGPTTTEVMVELPTCTVIELDAAGLAVGRAGARSTLTV